MDKRKLYGTILGGIAFIVVIMAVTYARYVWKSTDTDLSFSISDSYFYCESGIENQVSSLTPVLDYRGTSAVESFLVKNVGRSATTFSINLNINNIDESLRSESLKYKIMLDSSGGSNICTDASEGDCTLVAEGDFSEAIVGVNTLAGNVALPNNSKYEFYLFIYIDGNMANDPAMQSSSMTYTLDVCEVVVFFDYNGGSGDMKFLKVTDKYIGLPNATKENTVIMFDSNGGSTSASQTISYDFDGWYNNSSFTTKINEGADVTATTNHTLHAKWIMRDSSGTTDDGCISLPTVTKTGYTFNGWYEEDTLTNKVEGTSYCLDRNTNSGNVTLYAKWTANVYSISYNRVGGTVSSGSAPTSGTYDKVVSVNAPKKVVTVTGYLNGVSGATVANSPKSGTHTFSGWTATGLNTSTALYGASSTTVTNSWNGTTQVKGSSDTYFKNLISTSGGSVTLVAHWNDLSIVVPTLTKTGYICLWNTKSDGSGDDIASGGTYVSAGTSTATSVSLYGKSCTANSYTVVYDGNGNTGGAMSNSTHTYDQSKNLNANAYVRTGYKFIGWATSSSGSVVYTDSQSVSNLTATNGGTVTLYAKWEKDEVTVKYYNGSTLLDTISVYRGVASNLETWSNLGGSITNSGSSYGWSFAGWTTSTSGLSPSYTNGQSVTLRDNTNLYAVYKRTLTFYSGVNRGTTDGTSTQYYNPYGGNISSVNSYNPASISNWSALGYRVNTTAATSTLSSGTATSISPTYTSNNILYAVYSRTLTITYNANGGSGSMSNTTKTVYLNTNSTTTSSQSVTLAANGFTYTNHDFNKWAAGSTSGTEYDAGASYNPNLAYNVSNFGTTMYAKWTAITVNVNYYNGSTLLSTKTVNKGVASNLETWANLGGSITNSGSSYGWSFAGWTTSTSGVSTPYTNGQSVTLEANTTLYAVYKRTLTFYSGVSRATTDGTRTQYYNSKGGNISSVNSYNPDSISNWSALGYRVNTTATTSTLSSGTATSISPTYTSNNILYAVYSRTLTITYNANGGSGSMSNTTKTVYLNTNSTTTSSQSVTLAANGFTYTGHDFTKWAAGSTSGTEYAAGASYNPNLAYNASTFVVNMYAKWEANTVNVNYYNGSTLLSTKTVNKGVASNLETWANLGGSITNSGSSYGWSFAGWSTSNSGISTSYTNGQSVTFSANTNLYAVYKRTLTFYSGVNRGTTDGTRTQRYNPYGGAISEIKSYEPDSIDNWTTFGYRQDTSAAAKTISSGTAISISPTYTSNNILYAVYSRTLTITYNANGGSGSMSNTTKTVYLNTNSTTTSSQSVTLAANGFTYTGHDFTKWAAGSTSGTEYAASTAYNPNLAYNASTFVVNMYAKWSSRTVNVNYYNGSTLLSTKTVNKGVASNLETWANLGGSITSSGYGWSFAGWSTSTSATTTPYSDGGSANFSVETNLYAIYKRTLTFYSGVSKATTDGTRTQYYNSYGGNISSVKSYAPVVITGWTPAGYRQDTSATTSTIMGGTTTDISPTYTSNNNFYAVYNRWLTITYNANGGSGTMSNTTKLVYLNTNSTTTSDQTVTLSANTFTKSGDTFDKWAEGSTSGTKYSSGGNYNPMFAYNSPSNFSMTMYALWITPNYGVAATCASGTYSSYYTNLDNAIDGATAGQCITLLTSYTDPSVVTFNKNLSLHTNGNTLTRTSHMTVDSGVTLTKVGSGSITSSTYTLIVDGNLTVSAGAIHSTGYHGVYNRGAGTVTINGGTISNANNLTVSALLGNWGANNGGRIVMSSGLIVGSIGVSLYYSDSFTMTGGTIYANNNNGYNSFQTGTNHTGGVTIAGGTIGNSSYNAKAVSHSGTGWVTMSAGNMVSGGSASTVINNSTGTLSLYGGTITSKGSSVYNASTGVVMLGKSSNTTSIKISTTGVGYPTLYCGNSSSGSKAVCLVYKGATLTTSTGRGVYNKGGDYRQYEGTPVSCTGADYWCIYNVSSTYTSASCSILTTCTYGSVYVRRGVVQNTITAAIGSSTPHNKAVWIGLIDDALYNFTSFKNASYAVNNMATGPLIRANCTGSSCRGVMIDVSGYDWVFENGIVGGGQAYSNRTPSVTRGGNGVNSTTYNSIKYGSVNN